MSPAQQGPSRLCGTNSRAGQGDPCALSRTGPARPVTVTPREKPRPTWNALQTRELKLVKIQLGHHPWVVPTQVTLKL